MADRLRTSLAMSEVLTRGMFGEAHLEQLARVAELSDPAPLERLDDARAKRLLADTEVLLTAWGCPRLDGATLARAPRLRAVVHAGGTVKHHVTSACFERGIRVSSAASANATPVAEYTLAVILLAGKRVFRLERRYRELRAGRLWSEEVPDPSNYRKTVGIVGASHIGRRVLRLLAAHDLDLLLADPTIAPADARELGATLCELPELLSRADVVSLHAPALPETHHLIDAGALSRMRDGAVLVNTARGHLVDGEALERELVSGRIDAVLDTTEPEVLPADSPLYELPNVFLTPHVAGSLGSERGRMVELAIDEIGRLARGEPLAHEVHADDWGRIA